MKTETLIAGLLGAGALAFFATRRASAKNAIGVWCAGTTQGQCDAQGATAEEAARNYLAMQPAAGLSVMKQADIGTATGVQNWFLTADGIVPIAFVVWRLS